MKTEQNTLPLIEFFPSLHMYTLNGIVIPSVTQVVSWVVRKDYSEVPASVLKEKADYGNRIHRWVEEYAKNGIISPQTETMEISTAQLEDLFEENGVIIERTEEIVHYGERYAGTYDMYGYVDTKQALIDIKTTAEYDGEYLGWQLGMYKLAMEEEGMQVDKTYCLWMPKKKRVHLIEVVPKNERQIIEALDRWEESLLEDLPF